MKAVILCAGRGSRLGSLAAHCPKTLLPVGEMTILDRILQSLKLHSPEKYVVVVGDKREMIERHLQKFYPSLPVTFVVNRRFTETNTGYSLFLTREAVGEGDFIKIDGDLLFVPLILERLVQAPFPNGVLIDRSVVLGEEEVKVVLDGGPDASETKINAIGKEVPAATAHGESIGMERIGKETASFLFEELEKIFEKEKKRDAYYELAYHRLIQKGVPFHAVDVTGLDWVEVDDEKDLAKGRELFRSEHRPGIE